MDAPFENMEDFSKHILPIPRRFPSPLAVSSVGWVRRKQYWVKVAFPTYNFSLILAGSGEYTVNGRKFSVEPPCVITQAPGVLVDYGPKDWWSEIYLIYEAGTIPELIRAHLLDVDRPFWRMPGSEPMWQTAAELLELCRSSRIENEVDRIDRTAERLILETLLPIGSGQIEDPVLRAVERVRRQMRRNLALPFEMEEAARAHGVSPSSFRRGWMRQVGVSPLQYLTQVRMEQACRLLAESELRINEIAAEIGFQDALYFCRIFRRETGVTATEYRKTHQKSHRAFFA